MAMLAKLGLYLNTASHLKPSQVGYRIHRKLRGKTPLKRGYVPNPGASRAGISRVPPLSELDFDPVFLCRFDCDALLAGELTLLHVTERVDWSLDSWRAESQKPLWRFNMHYCEYLLPLAKRFIDTGDDRYLDAAKMIVRAWIEGNPRSRGGPGWDSYTVSMRIVWWLAFYGELSETLECDREFVGVMNASLVEQYVSLSEHLEKDLLANHYLENLKALVILAAYFADDETLDIALPQLEAQIEEQVLPDGVHYELSPMYQKIVLEDLLRVAACLRACARPSEVIEARLKPMCDFVFSMELGANRTPLFNDSGDNVARSVDALLRCAKARFGIVAEYRGSFPDAGYYLLEGKCAGHAVKVIFDAGGTCPPYAMGHMHCDELSLECFIDGKPLVVNCGTYAYQGPERPWFRSSEASSAVQIDGREQHECWGGFRTARYGRGTSAVFDEFAARARFVDHRGGEAERTVSIEGDSVVIRTALLSGTDLTCRYHLADGVEGEADGRAGSSYLCALEGVEARLNFEGADNISLVGTRRANEFGLLCEGRTIVAKSFLTQTLTITFGEERR